MTVAALMVAACNDDGGGAADKPAAVARVGDAEISRATYERVLKSAAADYATVRTHPGRRYFVPPRYALCVRDRRERRSVPADWPPARVRTKCRHDHRSLRGELLSNLIEGEWLRQEGARQGLRPPADLDARLAEFPAQLGEAAASQVDLTISDADVARYYRRHRSFLRRPEQRWWRAVLSDTEAKAQRARQALEQGGSWDAAARRYNAPEAGRLPQDWLVDPGTDPPKLDRLIFSARRGELIGPIAMPNGFYVLMVEQIEPPRQYSLEASRPAILPVLETSRKEQAQIDYWRSMRLASRRRTVCLIGPKVPECSNGPRARFDADGMAFRRSDQRPTLPPPPVAEQDAHAGRGETPELPQ